MRSELANHAPEHWTCRPIENVCIRVTSGGTPSRRNGEFYENGRWPWVKTQELHDRWLDDTEEHITDDAITKSSAKVLPEQTVLLALYGATVGQLGILRRPMTCNQACCAMIVDPNQADFRYLYYALIQSRQQLKSLASGAAQQNLSGKLMREFVLPFPDVTIQRRIASVLGALDDKIELNRRMNRTLEQMAAALFQSWFIDFDPVHASAEGRPPNLPPDLANLFPNTFEPSALGPIPKGWNVSTVGDEFRLTMGQSPPGETYNESREGMPFFQGRRDFGFRYPSHRVYCTTPTRYAAKGDTLMSVRAPVGDVNMAIDRCSIGRGVAAARHKSDSITYTYYAFRSLRERFEVYNGEGTVFGSISQKDLRAVPWIAPDDAVISQFDDMVGHVDHRIEINEMQNRRLAGLRDILLPKLLSGEIELPEAEDLVEEMR